MSRRGSYASDNGHEDARSVRPLRATRRHTAARQGLVSPTTPLRRPNDGGTSIGHSDANRRPPNWRPWPVCAWPPVAADGYDTLDRATWN